MSGLVTPDRSLARGEARWGRGRSAPVMYTSQALTRDTLHPWHTFHHICHHRACWKPPGALSRRAALLGACGQSCALVPCTSMAGAGGAAPPGVWPCPGSQQRGQLGVQAEMLSGTWRTGNLCQHPHPTLSWLGSLDSRDTIVSPAWCPSVYLES